MSPDLTERLRTLSPVRLDLLRHRLSALRPAAAPPPAPSEDAGPWLAEELFVPLRLRGALDVAALERALTVLLPALEPFGLRSADLRERPLAARHGEALLAASAQAGLPRALLARLDASEHVLVLVLRPSADAPALLRELHLRYGALTGGAARAAEPALAAPTAEDLLAGVQTFSDEDVDLLLGQLEAGHDARPARPLARALDPRDAESLLAGLDQLADDDVDALLTQLSDGMHG